MLMKCQMRKDKYCMIPLNEVPEVETESRSVIQAFLIAQLVKNTLAMQETLI